MLLERRQSLISVRIKGMENQMSLELEAINVEDTHWTANCPITRLLQVSKTPLKNKESGKDCTQESLRVPKPLAYKINMEVHNLTSPQSKTARKQPASLLGPFELLSEMYKFR